MRLCRRRRPCFEPACPVVRPAILMCAHSIAAHACAATCTRASPRGCVTTSATGCTACRSGRWSGTCRRWAPGCCAWDARQLYSVLLACLGADVAGGPCRRCMILKAAALRLCCLQMLHGALRDRFRGCHVLSTQVSFPHSSCCATAHPAVLPAAGQQPGDSDCGPVCPVAAHRSQGALAGCCSL